MLTNEGVRGILSKLSARATAGLKKSTTFVKKVLTNAKRCGNIYNVPRLGRVPCKLNNERNEKHQTGALKSATKKLA